MVARAILLASLVLALLSGCSSAQLPAATVDGIDISNERVANDVDLFTAMTAIAQQPCSQPETNETLEAACARAMLSNLIEETVLGEYASAHDIGTEPGAVTRTVIGLKQQVGGAEVVDQALADANVSLAAFRNLARRVVLFGNVQTAVADELVSEADVRAAYEADPLAYTTLHAEHILVDTRKQADEVYREVTAPGATEQDFLDLAKRASKDNTADLGSLPATQLDRDFVHAALALRPGEISPPVHTQFGWHVIRLVDANVTPFASARASIEGQLSQRAFNDWLDRELHAATIEVNPRYGRWDASVPGVLPITSTATGSAAPAAGAGSPSPTAP